jgi:hypothetical protein
MVLNVSIIPVIVLPKIVSRDFSGINILLPALVFT